MTNYDAFLYTVRQIDDHRRELEKEETDKGRRARIKEIQVLCHHARCQADWLEAAFLRKAKANWYNQIEVKKHCM